MNLKILYHITSEENLLSILENGVVVDSGRDGLTRKYHRRDIIRKNIFLTDNIDYIIEKQTGLEFIKKYKYFKLFIDVSNLKINNFIFNEIVYPHEFICSINIPRENILKFSKLF